VEWSDPGDALQHIYSNLPASGITAESPLTLESVEDMTWVNGGKLLRFDQREFVPFWDWELANLL